MSYQESCMTVPKTISEELLATPIEVQMEAKISEIQDGDVHLENLRSPLSSVDVNERGRGSVNGIDISALNAGLNPKITNISNISDISNINTINPNTSRRFHAQVSGLSRKESMEGDPYASEFPIGDRTSFVEGDHSSQEGDHLDIKVNMGNVNYELEEPSKTKLKGVRSLRWSNICYEVDTVVGKEKEKKTILTNCSGSAMKGRLLAIMGPSGSGKTSLLNILAGRIAGYTGSIYVGQGGQGVLKSNADRRLFAQKCGFVQQHDLFYEQSTVYEHLTFCCRMLNIPQGRVDESLARMNLTKAKDTRIGGAHQKGLSGGEKKRLAIGQEVLRDPDFMLADEPTSGLDSSLAQDCIEIFKSLGKIGIISIHQPNFYIYNLFDDLCLMAESEVIYLGTRNGALKYFEGIGYPCPTYCNPAEFLIDLVTFKESREDGDQEGRNRIDKLKQSWREKGMEWQKSEGVIVHNDPTTSITPAAGVSTGVSSTTSLSNSPKSGASPKRFSDAVTGSLTAGALVGFGQEKPNEEVINALIKRSDSQVIAGYGNISLWTEISALCSRIFWVTSRDPLLTKARCGQTIVMALIIGLIYLRQDDNQHAVQNKMGALFFIIVNQAMSCIMGMAHTFPVEKPMIIREVSSGMYSIGGFFFAKNITDLPFQVTYPFVFAVACFFLIGFDSGIEHGYVFQAVLEYLVFVILASVTGIGFGYFVSAIAPSVGAAMAIAPVMVLPLMVFGGLFVNLNSTPVYFIWLEAISFPKYAFESASIAIWQNVRSIGADPGERVRYNTGKEVIDDFGFDLDNQWTNVLFLLLLLFGSRFLAYLVLRKKCLEQRI